MDAKSLNSSENSCDEVKFSSNVSYVSVKSTYRPKFSLSGEEKEKALLEGKIKLLDGSELKCYPLPQTMPEVDNTTRLDTTGTYLIIGRNNAKKHVKTEKEKNAEIMAGAAEKQLFLENAFLLLANSKRILSDSRMFLCPVPIQNGLAYTGTSGFHCLTLGVYIEWWMNCRASVHIDGDGTKWLVYCFVGSPLSGRNNCGLVNEQGKMKSCQVGSFSELWRPFVEINSRYDYAKSRYEAYSLKQVLELLGTDCDYNAVNILFLENRNMDLTFQVSSLRNQVLDMTAKLHKALMELKTCELRNFIEAYNKLKDETDKHVSDIREERIRLRKLLRSNAIGNVEYQKNWSPLRRAKESAIYKFQNFVYSSLLSIFPDERITLDEVKEFLEENDKDEKNIN